MWEVILVSSVNTIKLVEVIEGQNQDKTISVHHTMLSLDQDTIKSLKANTNFTLELYIRLKKL